jgi:hypothetical protein
VKIFLPREREMPMEVLIMFDSIEDQMKNVAMEGTPKEKWTKYIIISAISIAAVGGIFAAVQFIK